MTPDKERKDKGQSDIEKQESIEVDNALQLYYSLPDEYGDYLEDLEPKREGTDENDGDYLGFVVLF